MCYGLGSSAIGIKWSDSEECLLGIWYENAPEHYESILRFIFIT